MFLRTIFLALIVPTWVPAGEAEREFAPRPIKLLQGERTVDEVLKELQKQTGNVVLDRRTTKTGNARLTLQAKTFWETMDALGEQSGIGFSAYQTERIVALVDTPYRKMMVHRNGLFRFAVRRVAVTRNDEAGTHHADVALDIAWEPRLEPIFVNLESAIAGFGNKAQKLERQAMLNVAGMGATDKIELRMQAPPRAAAKIDSLRGALRVIAAPKMLEFTFANLKEKDARSAKQDGVEVSLANLRKTGTRWSIEVMIRNPPGAIPEMESFRAHSWMDNNRVWLSWTDPKTKQPRTLSPDPAGEFREETKDGMKISFDFEARGTTALPPANAEVTLHYRTPNRVTAFTVPFEFRDLPLP